MKQIAVLLLIMSGLANAAGSSGYNTIININQRECNNDHDFEITLAEPHENPDSCSNSRVVNVSCTHPGITQISSMALTAMITEKRNHHVVNRVRY